MPTFGPIQRRDLIRYLKMLGFQGPFAGSRHTFMSKGDISLRIPNPHEGDIGREFCGRPKSAQGRVEWSLKIQPIQPSRYKRFELRLNLSTQICASG